MSNQNDVILQLIEAIAEQDGVSPNELGYSLQDHIETDVGMLAIAGHKEWELSFTVALRSNGEMRIDGRPVREVETMIRDSR
jgi:hypothetical protein